MARLITPEELPRWVPGEVLAASDGLGWSDVSLRAYRYRGLDVAVPPMATFMIVSYKRGSTRVQRRFEGRWTRTECHPGDVSLLTRAQQSHWHWTNEIDVAHAYLSDALMSRVAADVLGRPISEVRLHDLLRAHDPLVSTLVDAMIGEATGEAIGGAMYAEALSTQLAVHLLRKYASVSYRAPVCAGGLSPATCRRLKEYVQTRLHESITLAELADLAGTGPWTFGRRFRHSFGQAPHAWVMQQRLERAREMLGQGTMALKQIASACGFFDQAHLTRVMRTRLGTTPAALRRDLQG